MNNRIIEERGKKLGVKINYSLVINDYINEENVLFSIEKKKLFLKNKNKKINIFFD